MAEILVGRRTRSRREVKAGVQLVETAPLEYRFGKFRGRAEVTQYGSDVVVLRLLAKRPTERDFALALSVAKQKVHPLTNHLITGITKIGSKSLLITMKWPSHPN